MAGLINPGGDCEIDEFTPFDKNAAILQKVTFVPETPYVEDMSAMKIAKLIAPFYPEFDFNLLENLLTEFEVPKESSLRKMSLGQQKKAVIALSIANNTPYLFMDEPTNGLDIPSKAVFRRVIAACLTEGKTILISTHQVRDLENLIDSVVILDNHGCILNRTIFEIEDKLAFRTLRTGDEPLYRETSLKGDRGIVVKDEKDDDINGYVDLELLFNAVVEQKEEINELFKN